MSIIGQRGKEQAAEGKDFPHRPRTFFSLSVLSNWSVASYQRFTTQSLTFNRGQFALVYSSST